MKLSKKIKLEYWQGVTTGKTHATLELMLTEALDKMEEELNQLKEPKPSRAYINGSKMEQPTL